MRFAGPRQHNVYLLNNKAFATAIIRRPAFTVLHPNPAEPAQLAVQGVIFQELVIAYGENGWPTDAAESLLEHVETTLKEPSTVDTRSNFLTTFVLHPFNQLFPPQTESDGLKWANVQWEMPFVEIDKGTEWPYIKAKSDDHQFIMELKFSEDHVLVSYCGPVTFNMQNVQPTVTREFYNECTFPIVQNGSFFLGQWPADEAVLLVNVQNNWEITFNHPDYPLQDEERVKALVKNLLLHGVKNLMVVLASAGQERQNHDLDSRLWEEQDWDPVEVDGNQLHMQSANGAYNIYWNFVYGENGVNYVEITCLAPCRFKPRRPQVQPAQA